MRRFRSGTETELNGITEYTVQDIHDVLKSYYEVARKRFVDTVIMQGADYHLITGSASPLRVFSPKLVSEMTPQQLEFIAGEEVGSKRKRQALSEEISALRSGKKLLSI